MRPDLSRQDLTVEEIDKRIREVKRDRSFPKKWVQVELDYLYELKRHKESR